MFTDRQTDKEPDYLQGCDLSRSSSRARNTCNTKFCENCLSGSRDLRELCLRTELQTDNLIFYKVETYLDRLLVLEIYVIPNFVKIFRAVLEIVNIYVPMYVQF